MTKVCPNSALPRHTRHETYFEGGQGSLCPAVFKKIKVTHFLTDDTYSPPCNYNFPRIETQENDWARGGPVYETGEHGLLIGAEKV